ncbi:unnamed protein product [Heterobilharzia americana]|nr:unnamed protein product [Heterobilharzia americana]
MPPFEPSPPQIISCLISLTNGVLVIRKPICSCDSLPTNKKPSGLLADRAIWWKSVAIGRTLTAGMQECAFMGMESFLLHSDYLPISSNCRQPISNASCSVLSSLETSSGSNNLSSKPLIYDQSLHKNSSKQQKLKSLRVTSLSNECCSIEWNPNFDSAVSASDHTFEVNEKSPSILTSNEMISGYQHLRGLDRVGRINDLSATKRFRRNSTPCNSGQANGQTMVMLKGILKQRSVSESSGDETGILEANNLRGAGLAGYRDNPLSSDEFPTASSDENHELISSEQHFNFRRCISSDKLSVVETTQKDIQCNQLPVCRPRLRSVSFSQHDQRVDFSPRDTVEALHHTLCSRRKKLRRRDARHRRGSDRSSNHSDNESGKSASKLDDEINVCTRIVCESPNNTLFFSTKNEALFKGNSGNLATELCDINSTKSLHDSVFQVSSIPNITESNNDIDDESEYVHVGNPNTGLEDNDKPTTGFPVASTHTNNSLFRSGCNETNNVGDMTHYNISAVHLTSSSILELDEE